MRVAILGAGTMGEAHAHAYAGMNDVEIAAIYARSGIRAGPLAAKLGTTATTRLDDALDDPSVHAVDVCVPSNVHREFLVAALKAGKHVFCETPLALMLHDAEAMIQVAWANDRLLMAALLMRSIDDYQYLRRAVVAGELGRILAVHAYRLGSYLRRESADFKEHYSEPTTELMTFDFDAINWMFGLPNEVYAAASPMGGGTPGHVMATLRCNDFIATVEASGMMPSSFHSASGCGWLESEARWSRLGSSSGTSRRGPSSSMATRCGSSPRRAPTRTNWSVGTSWIAYSERRTPSC